MDEQKAVEYLDSLGNKRMFMTMNEVDLINLVLKYKKQINKAIEKIEKDAELIDLEDGYTTCMAVIDILRGENDEN